MNAQRSMTAASDAESAGPSLAEQVSRLYDLIAGYHLTQPDRGRARGRGLGADRRPARDRLKVARRQALGTDPHYTDVLCRTAFAFELLEREGDGWRMAPHMDTILGDPGVGRSTSGELRGST